MSLRGVLLGRGEYIWTAGGRKFWPLDPRIEDVFIEDIARGLSTECRYAGQIGFDTGYSFYSVAEHSVIVSIYAEREAQTLRRGPAVVRDWALKGLLHDASEAYIGDVCRPLKYGSMFRAYRRVEARLQRVIEQRFAVTHSPWCDEVIKAIDTRVIRDEVDAFIALPGDTTLDELDTKYGQPLGANITGLVPAQAYRVFMQRYRELAS